LAIAFFVWLAAHLILVGFVSTDRVQRAFAARISAAFGRPVEVGNFAISILEGPRLVANYITVSEDPRFGREHFLRAERLTAAIRWTALLRGRLEFDTVSFTRPSLNLVRNADGTWNLESWLPAPSASRGARSNAALRQALLTRINIDTGRINFKRGADKHPFAFTNVDGFVARDSSGHWRVDLEATVMRAGVTVQEPGTLRLRGRIGSAASRLQPAELALTWQEASLSDALRLARGHDYGARGNFAMDVSASVPAPASSPVVWSLKGDLRLRDVHGWNLAQQAEDPDLNLLVEAKWTPQSARVEFSKILLDAPRSNVRASGFLQWAQPQASDFRILSSAISLNDLLDWYRAFRPGVAPDLRSEGNAGLDADLGGWPLGVHRVALASAGAQMAVPGLREPLRMGRAVLRWTPAKMELLPIQFTLSPAAAAARQPRARAFRLSLTGAGTPRASGNCAALLCADFKLSLAGQMDRLQDFLGVTRAFGWPLDGGWAVDGPASFSVIGEGRLFPWTVNSRGSVRFAGTRLLPPFMNLPIVFKDAQFVWSPAPGERRLTLTNSEVFGSRWTGFIAARESSPWEFSLVGDRLEIAAVNQWLNPARQQGLFQRLISSAATRRGSAEYEDQLGRLRARGRVQVAQLTLAPVSLHKLRGTLELDGRKLSLTDAQADFYGGAVRGSFLAELALEPKYEVQATFERVNLAALTAPTVTLKNIFSGTASGELSLSTRGIGRENLSRMLEGQGKIQIYAPQWRGLDLRASVEAGASRPGSSRFNAALGPFSIAQQKLQLISLELVEGQASLDVSGSITFSNGLDLVLKSFTKKVTPPLQGATIPMRRLSIVVDGETRLTGTLSAPRLVRSPPAKKP